jgi:hypothetical protein
MALWGSQDEANNAPKNAVVSGLGVSANGETLYQDVTISTYVANAAVGVFGVDTTEQNVVANPKGGHAGWVLRKAGTGPVVSITANTGSYSPDGNVYISFTDGGSSNVTANAQVFTNSVSKLITSVVVNTGGEYTLTPAATAVNANATFAIVMGGRANRVQLETLVAMGSMGADGSSGDDDEVFPNA